MQQSLRKLALLKSMLLQKSFQHMPKPPRIAELSAPPLQTHKQLSPHSLARSLVALAHSTSSTSSSLLAPTLFQCAMLIDRSHHMRYHNKQKICETCQASFGIVTHLERHINSVHKTAKVYHCTVAGCSYFKTANPSKSFSRKDNWRRHMIEQHGSGQGDDLGVMDFENHVIDS
jgi:hypothetical protein